MVVMVKGDEVLIFGGLVGCIIKIVEDNVYIIIELNINNEVVIKKDFVIVVLLKGMLKFF